MLQAALYVNPAEGGFVQLWLLSLSLCRGYFLFSGFEHRILWNANIIVVMEVKEKHAK